MHDMQPRGYYTDQGDFAPMTRIKAVKDARLFRIAGHLCRIAEDLAFSTTPPSVDNCRIAAMMLGYAYNLAPLRIEIEFAY